MKNHKRIFFIAAVISLLVVCFSQCMNNAADNNQDPRGEAYAGSVSCRSCHKAIYDAYATTAHRHTSSPASKKTIKGSFAPNENIFSFDTAMKVVMEQRDSGLYQVAYVSGEEKQAHRFDIVFGSGRKAQTYLYWKGNQIFQLPISYFVTAHSWVNSPKYPAHQIWFDRVIPIRCFECHSSFLKKKSTQIEGFNLIDAFDRNGIIYGIDCERCHGPAAQHVFFQQSHPQEKKAKYITLYASLSRQQKLDMCAVCHSGIKSTQKSTFSFTPGDTLANYYYPYFNTLPAAEMDVHGNQYQLLSASKCFIMSKTLECASCHNTHVTERDNLSLFSTRCMNCHTEATHNFCTMQTLSRETLIKNCIDCHMPAAPSRVITLLSQGHISPTPNKVRTHLIAIYPEAVKKFLSAVK